MRACWGLLLCLLTAACGGGQPQPAQRTPSEELQGYYRDGLAGLSLYEDQTDCSSPNLTAAVMNVNRLQHKLRLYQQRQERALLDQTVDYHQDLSMRIAEVADAKACWEVSEYFYRKIIAVYPGARFAPIRAEAEGRLQRVLAARGIS